MACFGGFLNAREVAKRMVERMLSDAGLDAQALLALAEAPDVKHALKTAIDAAVQRGVFGCPMLFVGDAMFFSQDRLDFVREALWA